MIQVFGASILEPNPKVSKNNKAHFKRAQKTAHKEIRAVQLKKAKQQLIGQLAIAQENNCNLMQSNAKSYQAFGKVASVKKPKKK